MAGILTAILIINRVLRTWATHAGGPPRTGHSGADGSVIDPSTRPAKQNRAASRREAAREIV
ncbi:hypothetical protein [Hymenobacter radiodurans]|nr:hypothetical protein [Hymenobacter radiodurans]